jgi:preprotein translocase subunit SecG
MNIVNFLKFKKQSFTPDNLGKSLSDFWDKHSGILFFLFSLITILLGVYLWYQNIYQSEWNSEKKNQYKSSQNKEVNFKENDFKNAIKEIERKKENYNSKLKLDKDIFIPYSAEKKEEISNNIQTSENGSTLSIF